MIHELPEGDYAIEEAWEELEDPSAYLGTPECRDAYAKVLVRLPSEVREFTLDHCFVVGVGRDKDGEDITALTWPLSMIDKRQRRWLIIICSERDGELEDGIAHEIAHARRGDDRHTIENETGADALAMAWGFKPSYLGLSAP